MDLTPLKNLGDVWKVYVIPSFNCNGKHNLNRPIYSSRNIWSLSYMQIVIFVCFCFKAWIIEERILFSHTWFIQIWASVVWSIKLRNRFVHFQRTGKGDQWAIQSEFADGAVDGYLRRKQWDWSRRRHSSELRSVGLKFDYRFKIIFFRRFVYDKYLARSISSSYIDHFKLVDCFANNLTILVIFHLTIMTPKCLTLLY